MNAPSLCRDEDLKLLLGSEEGSNEFQRTALHVDTCAHCQGRLGELAAQESDWQEAQEMLLALEDTPRPLGNSQWGGTNGTHRWPRIPAAWSDSMAKQLLSPPSHPEMLGRIGRYEVERIIGSGGMGVVFKAFDTELNRPVAVKVLAPYLASSGAARQRFAREARAAAAVVHEHVVPIHNVETDGAAPFLVMHYVAGESLQQRLDRQGPLELCEILRIALQTAAGLAAAHAQGLVHRDVKPSNILLEERVERALLTDFGLARASDDASLTQTGYHPGTPQYMSPEQARGEAVDTRSDLFSFGSVLYVMCTGRMPFRAESTYGILRRITDNEPRPVRDINPAIPDWLVAIIFRLHRKLPEQRFHSASELHDVLKACLAHVQQPQTVPLPEGLTKTPGGPNWRQFWQHGKRRPLIFAGILAALSLAVFPWLLPQQTTAPTNDDRSAAEPEPVATPSAPSTPMANEQPEDNSQVNWDSTSAEISGLNSEVDAIEPHFHQIWDHTPYRPPLRAEPHIEQSNK